MSCCPPLASTLKFLLKYFKRLDFRVNVTAKTTGAGAKNELTYNNLLSCKNDPLPQPSQFQLAICALLGVKHIKRVPEFVVYHSLVGVEKIYIYFHGTKDDFVTNWNYFKPFVENGILEVVPYFFTTKDFQDGIQLGAYNDCLHKSKDKAKWLGILDVDEFFQIQTTSRFESLVDLMNFHEEYSSIAFIPYFYALKNEDDAGKYVENCEYPSFINDWTLCRDEHLIRPSKMIHSTMANDYIGVHRHVGKRHAINVSTSEAVLAHYRYPYKSYTISGIADGSYTECTSFKTRYGQQVIENLQSYGYDLKCDL